MKNYIQKTRKGKGGFTLLELMVVMTIIIILAGVMTPAIKKILEKAKIRSAQQTALQMATSIATYQSEYRRFPVDVSQAGGADVQVETDEALMDILLGQEKNRYNPSGTAFFSGRNARGRPPRNGLVFNEDGGGRLYDPWGNHYRVMIDTDNNHRIEPPFEKIEMTGANRVAKNIIVWSLGPDGVESGDGAKDNVIIW